MKKQIISAFVLLLTSFAVAEASESSLKNIVINISQEKVAIKPEDLPEGIKTVLADDDYAGWQVVSAFLVTKPDNSQFYEVSLKKGEESANINFDKEGKRVE